VKLNQTLYFAVLLVAVAVGSQAQTRTDLIGTVNSQTGTSYTFGFSDRGKLVTFSNASPVAVTLPQATSSGSFRSGWTTFTFNLGAGTVTITPTTSTINGSASITLATGEGATIFSNGTNYLALRTTVATAGSGGIGTVTTTGSPANGNLAKFSGATSITNTDLTGDITTSGGVATTIANDAVSYAKMQNISAASKLLGRGDSGSGDPQEITIGSGLSMSGTTLSVPAGAALKAWLPAAGCNNATAGTFWDLPTSTPAAAACVTGTNTQKGVLDFADTSGGFSAQNGVLLPSDWSGTLNARIIWFTTATSGNVKWSLSTICTAVGATETDDPSFNTASTVTTAAPGTANRLQTSSISSVTVTGCAAGELLHLKLFRDGNDGSDTISATARLVGVEIRDN